MNKEAIKLLKKAKESNDVVFNTLPHHPRIADIECTNFFIDQTLAILKEQPPAGDFTKEIEVANIKKVVHNPTWIEDKLLEACEIINRSVVSREVLLTALEMCERARACGQIEKIDKIILQAAIKANKEGRE